jgi:DNA-directed RNA polymerase subunit RPC12/RpoP
MNNCCSCGEEVDFERADFLISTNRKITCLDCSSEVKVTGFMDYNHKTAPQLVILPEDPEIKRIAKRAFCRAR